MFPFFLYLFLIFPNTNLILSGPTGKIRAIIFGFSKFSTKFKFIYRRTNGAENSVC